MPAGLPPYGFAVLLVTMMLSLGRRFSRANAEVREFSADLERRVQHRTRQLTEAVREISLASDAKSAFVANMSHELRTPLNSVIGYSEMLLRAEDSTLGAHGRRSLRHIHHGGEQLLRLVNEVLDIASVEAGRLETNPEPTDLASLLREVATTMRPLAEAKSLWLEVDVSEVGLVETDPYRFEQIMVNLTANAIKFTAEGRVTVRLSGGDAGHVMVEVSDTGQGIPAEKLDTVFEPFERLDGGSDDQRGGTGLGLAITAALCRELGIELDVTSEVGEGSTFSVTFPADPRAKNAVPARAGQ